MNFLVTNASLSMFEVGNTIDWSGFGFNVKAVAAYMMQGFQQGDGDRLVSILPIEDEAILRERLGEVVGTTDTFGNYFKIVSEAEAFAERDRLKVANDLAEEVCRNTPTDDDIFKAQQLKLLTEINMKLGGGANV
ncbi:MAG: hypothetical protein RSD07_10100 [Angelakisella sp.]